MERKEPNEQNHGTSIRGGRGPRYGLGYGRGRGQGRRGGRSSPAAGREHDHQVSGAVLGYYNAVPPPPNSNQHVQNTHSSPRSQVSNARGRGARTPGRGRGPGRINTDMSPIGMLPQNLPPTPPPFTPNRNPDLQTSLFEQSPGSMPTPQSVQRPQNFVYDVSSGQFVSAPSPLPHRQSGRALPTPACQLTPPPTAVPLPQFVNCTPQQAVQRMTPLFPFTPPPGLHVPSDPSQGGKSGQMIGRQPAGQSNSRTPSGRDRSKGGRNNNVPGSKNPKTPLMGTPSTGKHKRQKKTRFAEYWSMEDVSRGLKTCQIFRAKIRVNAYDRREAYVTVDGVGIDVLINGLQDQNRTFNGDEVAVQICPVSEWVDQSTKRVGISKDRGSKDQSGQDQSAKDQGIKDKADGKDQGRAGTSNNQVMDPGMEDCQLQSEVGDPNKMDSTPSKSSDFCPEDSFVTPPRLSDVDCQPSDSASFPETPLDSLTSALTRADLNGPSSSADCSSCTPGNETVDSSLPKSEQVSENKSEVKPKMQLVEKPIEKSDDKTGEGKEKSSESANLFGGGRMLGERDESSHTHSVKTGQHDRSSSAGAFSGSAGWKPCRETYSVKEAAEMMREEVERTGLRPTGRVVGLLVPSPRRETVIGRIVVSGDQWELIPADPRCPYLSVNVNQVPGELKQAHSEGTLSSQLVGARVLKWGVDSAKPQAGLRASLGESGEIAAETAAISFEFSLPPDDFKEAVLDCLPATPWHIPDKEMEQRRDLREWRIFSIDPPTARDLDDALSVEPLDSGRGVRVGVHIADVSHFVTPNTALDKEAQERSTSTYLQQKVVPMLPRLLCEELCSLNPGVQRLAFSIVWDIDPAGNILHQWCGRSVIRSCCKLSYDMAQRMIDTVAQGGVGSDAEKVTRWGVDGVQLTGGYTWDQVREDVLALHSLSRTLRSERFQSGSLRMNNIKLSFQTDQDGNPVATDIYHTGEANELVEEFMLLANRCVAKVISAAFPSQALLRRHEVPDPRKLEGLAKFCLKHGFEIDPSTSSSLHRTLTEAQRMLKAEGKHGVAEVLTLQVTKPMQLASYFCTGEVPEEKWEHYALAFSHYTHFTSPIRRYPDVIVHRLLAAALDAQKKLDDGSVGSAESAHATSAEDFQLPDMGRVAEISVVANERKLAAKQAQEASSHLYLCLLLRARPLETKAVVAELGPSFLELYVPQLGLETRLDITCLAQDGGVHISHNKKESTVTLSLRTPEQERNRAFQRRRRSAGTPATPGARLLPGTPAPPGGPPVSSILEKGVESVLPFTIRRLQTLHVNLTAVFELQGRPRVEGTLSIIKSATLVEDGDLSQELTEAPIEKTP